MSDSPIVKRLMELAAANDLTTGQDLLDLSQTASIREVELSASDYDEGIIELGKLDWSPRQNWIDQNGGLPKYIEEVAIGIMKGTGRPREQAIPIAINRIKRWAKGLDGVKADTISKSVVALAAWEKMKASAKAKRLAKKG